MTTSGRKRGALEITGLSIRYDSNRVVHNVDLSVPAGGHARTCWTVRFRQEHDREHCAAGWSTAR